MSARRPAAALLAATTLSLVTTSAYAVDRVRVSDPIGDAQVAPGGATLAQVAAVDLTAVSYTLGDEALTIITVVDDLSRTPGNEFIDTEVSEGDLSISLTTEVGKAKVKVFDGSHYYVCRGSSARAGFGADRMVQVVPLECLSAFEAPRLRTTAGLYEDDATPIVVDRAPRTGVVTLP
ncbi:MAG: hypothetical protein F2667_11400 [Actinobacteria bacterium]|uniref:Unannotated protein n=1 Tax=freshwater metagenome TaxID=449393 RepID=A0A6J6RN42_9ZZZZ|nr:hypothetical protein [Actinomycetota bacterium]